MQRKKPEVDVVLQILQASLEAQPSSSFLQSLLFQYQERGGLSKKQLEGLHAKAKKNPHLPAAKLATLEAEILKRPNRYKSEKPAPAPLYSKDENTGRQIDAVLSKYPQHKRVLFFKTKWQNNEPLSSAEITELQKFYKMVQ